MKSISIFCLTVLCMGLLSCSSTSMQAEPSQGAGFVPMDEMANREDLPFDKIWVKSGIDLKKYNTIYFKDVNTSYLIKRDWWKEQFRKDKVEADAKEVAQYMKKAFVTAFQKDPKKRFTVIETPDANSLTVELALTELVPSDPVLEAIGLAAPYGSGTVLMAAVKGSGARATVAFEAKIKDTSSGEVLAMAADRRYGKVAPINLRGLTWYGESEVVIDDWANEFVEIANKQPGEVIKPASPFTLSPW
ncbi:DUF3313 domain-containing protein [Desulfovibrio inopinatus]|uniref:DUF3313 domain-containing protein n=1 Tax=Desulfovibrio inopinatus TaxID=102109 RepID=UPI000417D295|nr:DUF3313 domain-containing protein [Desulfovibrio inopinatus]